MAFALILAFARIRVGSLVCMWNAMPVRPVLAFVAAFVCPANDSRFEQETTNFTGRGTTNTTDMETDTWSAGTATTLGREHWSQKKKGKAGWVGPKHACGLCNRPVRRGQGAVQCGHGQSIHLQCVGYTTAQAWKVLRGKQDFQCKCKKARVQKWLEETYKQRQRCWREKTTTKQVKEVKEQQKDKNIAPREKEADFVHHQGGIARARQEKSSRSGKTLEEAHIRVRKRPMKQEEHQRDGNGTSKVAKEGRRSSKGNHGGGRITGHNGGPRGGPRSAVGWNETRGLGGV